MGKFVKQDVREWCPSTTRPLLPTITDSLLAPSREVRYKHCPSQRSLSKIGLPVLPVLRTRRASSPGSTFSFSTWSTTATRASTLKSANWRPPSLCAVNGLGVLCLGMCSGRFAMLSRTPNGVSNEHSHRVHHGAGPSRAHNTVPDSTCGCAPEPVGWSPGIVRGQ